MKKLLIILLVSTAVLSCRDDDKDPRPDLNDSVGAITLVTDVSTTSWDLGLLATEGVSWDIDVDGFDLTQIESVSVQLIFTDKGRLPNPDPEGSPLDSVYAPIEIGTITSFPGTFNVTAAQIVDLIPDFTSTDDFFIGDNFNFIFPISTTDGRVLTTALNSDLCQQPAQPSFGGCNVSVNIVCPFVVADAIGTYTITADEFGLSLGSTFDVVAGTGPNEVILRNPFSHTESVPGQYDVVVTVDPATSIASVERQESWDVSVFVPTLSGGFCAAPSSNGSTWFSCIGSANFVFTYSVDQGTYGGVWAFNASKN